MYIKLFYTMSLDMMTNRFEDTHMYVQTPVIHVEKQETLTKILLQFSTVKSSIAVSVVSAFFRDLDAFRSQNT